MNNIKQKILIILFSYHHKNTEKIAKVFEKIFNAEIKKPQQIYPEEIQGYDLIGFGSGIYGAKNHKSLLNLVEKLPLFSYKRAFIFSTAALTNEKKLAKDHKLLRELLLSKGFIVEHEFQCKGFNTNSFMKYFGGMNKGRPNADDLKHAEEFALNLKQELLKNNSKLALEG
ncbi:MAG: flavodoxin [Promethearchaeota archaeon]|nr:MAG: flavodoxin [Candidatus Lokiarchaeota archaeon]